MSNFNDPPCLKDFETKKFSKEFGGNNINIKMTRGREVYAFNEIIEEGPAEHSPLERGLIVKNGCKLRRGDTIILDTSWLCIPCLPSLNWKDRVRQSVKGLDENDALAFK